MCLLQLVNGLVGWYEERNAGNAIAALKKTLALTANVKRDGEWTVGFEGLTPADWGAGLYPAISGQRMLFRLSGETALHPGPDPSFRNLLDGHVAPPEPLDSQAASGFSHAPPE